MRELMLVLTPDIGDIEVVQVHRIVDRIRQAAGLIVDVGETDRALAGGQLACAACFEVRSKKMTGSLDTGFEI